MEQRSTEWYQARIGKVTASRVADLMSKTKSGYAASRHNYMAELICQRLTGTQEDRYVNEAMRRGTEMEPFARTEYEIRNDLLVEEAGLIAHPEIADFAASPDGCVGHDGLLEIKVPNTWTHIETLKKGEPKREYFIQMQAQMACTGRLWCDFVSYDDRLPDHMAYFQARIFRDDAFIAEMLGEIRAFLGELDATIDELIGISI